MRCFFIFFVIWGLFFSTSLSATGKSAKETGFKDLHRKTAKGFVVPYTIRYNPDDWNCKNKDGGQCFESSKSRGLYITVSASSKDINLSQEELDGNFQAMGKKLHSDSCNFAGYEIMPSDIVVYNGLNFLHQKEIVNLSPEVMQRRERMGYTSDAKSKDQIDFYIYSGDKGSIYFCVESVGTISQKDQAAIDDLFKGFSLDGSACRGPKGLRFLKTAFEVVVENNGK